jgi:iron(III) transport system substrate-binding protein
MSKWKLHIASYTGMLLTVMIALMSCGGGSNSPSTSSSNWAAVVDAANQEGSVILYTQLVDSQIQRLTKAFTQAYPHIQLQVSRVIPYDVKIEQEESSGVGGADAFVGAQFDFSIAQSKAGKLLPLESPNMATYPTQGLFVSLNDVVSVFSIPYGFAYNTSLIKAEPKTYDDLLKLPGLDGKIGIVFPPSPNQPTVVFYEYVEKAGADILPRLRALHPKVYSASVPLTQDVVSGEIAVGFQTVASIVKPLVASGAPIKLVYPPPAKGVSGIFGPRMVAGALRSAKHPNAARVLMDFIVSQAGQTAINGDGIGVSLRSGIPGAIEVPTVSYDPRDYPPDKVATLTAKYKAMLGT